ncbi:MAG: alpha-N-acetylglucosaminidase [Bacteroidales bacterium]|nr:alpha-N-acetylglucosaminidase [Bacteroidales bacterium]
MTGIGGMMEGNMCNPVVYDLLYEMGWRTKPVELTNWIERYTTYRYGTVSENAIDAWKILLNTVYNGPARQEGTTESILCARPGLQVKSAFKYGTSKLYYCQDSLVLALKMLLSASDSLSHLETYRYDLVDVARQCLANHSQQVYKEWVNAFNDKNIEMYEKHSAAFLKLINEQDSLLATRPEFLLGKWIAKAREMGTSPAEKDLFEWNARMIITTWAHGSVAHELNDYAHREWSGMLKGYYLPRWQMYFDYLGQKLQGNQATEPDFIKWETNWAYQKESFQALPQGNEINMVKHLANTYFN